MLMPFMASSPPSAKKVNHETQTNPHSRTDPLPVRGYRWYYQFPFPAVVGKWLWNQGMMMMMIIPR